ncbi:carbohydrate ABC transporter permease [Fodinicola feengrottensis]|uniref:carbohydrate ABC transporter permease n=1 Tax=Fodinicola feengrottensis TaxID=435914 RepID=UPI002441A1E3|nr:sugar ABC transporter permease [Fodinicola feengrottensis]
MATFFPAGQPHPAGRAGDEDRPPGGPPQEVVVESPDTPVAWLFIAPAVLGFAVFAAYPTLRGIYLSFTDFHVLSPPQWVGLANIEELIGDDVFWHSLGVTIYFVVLSVVVGILISLITAVVMHRLGASTVVRGLILLPFLISGVVAARRWCGCGCWIPSWASSTSYSPS